MAKAIAATYITRGDLPAIAPNEIKVDPSENTRLYKFDVESLVESFLKEGQRQPVVVRSLPDNRVQLVAGYRRWTAAMTIWKRQEKEQIPLKDRFKLKCEVQKMSPEQAMDVNIIENFEREGLSPVEIAAAIDRYRKHRGWIGDEGTDNIAKLFRKYRKDGKPDRKWVTEHEELLQLNDSDRYLVHQHFATRGREGMDFDAAKLLGKISEDQRAEVLQKALKAKEIKGIDPVAAPAKAKTAKKTGSSTTTPDTSTPEDSPAPPPSKSISKADLKAAAQSTKGALPEGKRKRRTVMEILNAFDPNTEIDGPSRKFRQRVTDWINNDPAGGDDEQFDKFLRNFATAVAAE